MIPRKDLLAISALRNEEIEFVLGNARTFKEVFNRRVKKVPTLRGRHVLTLFYEPSTRTLSSFEVAAGRLSADVTNFSVSTSSVVKGESILDTVETLESMQVDYIIVRHSASGVPNLIARHSKASVLNAGDGWHAHPTQALLDAFTLREIWHDLAWPPHRDHRRPHAFARRPLDQHHPSPPRRAGARARARHTYPGYSLGLVG